MYATRPGSYTTHAERGVIIAHAKFFVEQLGLRSCLSQHIALPRKVSQLAICMNDRNVAQQSGHLTGTQSIARHQRRVEVLLQRPVIIEGDERYRVPTNVRWEAVLRHLV